MDTLISDVGRCYPAIPVMMAGRVLLRAQQRKRGHPARHQHTVADQRRPYPKSNRLILPYQQAVTVPQPTGLCLKQTAHSRAAINLIVCTSSFAAIRKE